MKGLGQRGRRLREEGCLDESLQGQGLLDRQRLDLDSSRISHLQHCYSVPIARVLEYRVKPCHAVSPAAEAISKCSNASFQELATPQHRGVRCETFVYNMLSLWPPFLFHGGLSVVDEAGRDIAEQP